MLVECASCEKPVIATSRGFVVDNIGPEEGFPIPRWTLLECENKHPLLVVQFDPGENVYGWHWDDPTRVYPALDQPLNTLIPGQLRQIHEEARACFRSKAFTAAAVMAGRTLECACALHGVKERDLHRSLAKMKEQGLIDGRLSEWADTLRTIRNAAAHYDGETVSKQDAADSIAFSEALLDYLYVLSARFEALKARRQKKLTAASETMEAPPTAEIPTPDPV